MAKSEAVLTDATAVRTLVLEDALVGMTLSNQSQLVVPLLQQIRDHHTVSNVYQQIFQYFFIKIDLFCHDPYSFAISPIFAPGPTISLMLAACGCGPGAPRPSCPMATRDRSWLCCATIRAASWALTPRPGTWDPQVGPRPDAPHSVCSGVKLQ